MTHDDETTSSDDLQRLENVLADVEVPGHTRRTLLTRAAAGAAGAAALTALGPAELALGQSTGGDDPMTIMNTAVTAEALAVTYLTAVVGNASSLGVSQFTDVLKAANKAEYDHYTALKSLGAKPVATKFWVPDAAVKSGNIFPTIETLETLFINAYLIAVTAFAKAHKDSLARYAGEIAGVEAQHRTLARFAQNKLPDNLAFESYSITSIGGIVDALKRAGIGLGQKGSKPGKFATFSPPPSSATTSTANDKPS